RFAIVSFSIYIFHHPALLEIYSLSLHDALPISGEFAARKSIGFVVNKIGKKQRSSSGKFGIIPIATQGTTALVSYFLMKKLGEDHIAKCVDYLNSKIVDTSMQES